MAVGTTIRCSQRPRGRQPAGTLLVACLFCLGMSSSLRSFGQVAAGHVAAPALRSSALALPEDHMPEGFVGLPFHTSVTATGGSELYSILVFGDLPPGVELVRGGSLVALSGVPTTSGAWEFKVNVADMQQGGSVTHSYVVHVGPALPQAATQTVTVTDTEAFKFADTNKVFFPARIFDNEAFKFADADNVFTPVAISDKEMFKLTDAVSVFGPAKATDGGETFHFGDTAVVRPSAMALDAETLHLTDSAIVFAKIGISPSTAPSGTYNVAYSQTFTAVGNYGPATVRMTSGILPTGLAFSGSGASRPLSGTPTQTGTFSFTLTATDSVNTTQVTYSLVINGTSQTITFPQPPSPVQFYMGESVTLTATSSAGSGYPLSYGVTGPATLSGSTLTYTGPGNVVVTATQAGDATHAAATPVQVSITVQPKLPSIFIANSNGTVSSFTSTYIVQSSATAGGGVGVAADSAGYMWSINTSGNGLTKFTDIGTVGASYSPGMTGARALVFDGNSILWVGNSNDTLSAVSSAGTVVSTAHGTVSAAPTAIAVDISGNIWMTNTSANTVDEVLGAAAPAAPLATATTSGTPATRP